MKCPLCGKVPLLEKTLGISGLALAIHLEDRHGMPRKNTLQCPGCEVVFICSSDLDAHISQLIYDDELASHFVTKAAEIAFGGSCKLTHPKGSEHGTCKCVRPSDCKQPQGAEEALKQAGFTPGSPQFQYVLDSMKKGEFLKSPFQRKS